MARIQLKIWHAPLATLQANLAEGEVGIASETNTFYKRPDGAATGALIPIGGGGGGGGVATMRAKVATTGNIALTGLQTIDGIALTAGDFVLVSSQTNPAQNGVYVAAAGAWVRAAGADAWTNLINAIYVVEQGITLADTIWICTSDTGGTLDTTAVTFQAVNNKRGAVLASVTPSADALPYFTGSGTATTTTLTAYARTLLDDADAATMLNTLGAQPVDADLTALTAMSTTGMLVRTGNGTAASRQLAVSGTGLSISNADGVAGNPTVTSNATSANTASAVVARDASGNFAAGTITAALSGNASTATKLATAHTLSLSGDATGSASFDGSASVTIDVQVADDSHQHSFANLTGKPTTIGGYGITDAQPLDSDLTAVAGLSTLGLIARTSTGQAATRSIAVSGTGLSISNADGIAGNPTVTSNATSLNTVSTLVSRDASGNFSAGTITAALTGNAATATRLATPRTLSLTGDATGSASFDGSANAAIALTLANSGVIAGTYSTVTVDAKGRVTAATNAGGSMTGGSFSGGTITSSTIDSTAIGATTPSTGRFTTLTTTGAGTIGGDLTINGNFTVNGTITSNSFSTSLYANGYQRLPSGLILQWGRLGIGDISRDYYGFAGFPIVFPNNTFQVNLSLYSYAEASFDASAAVTVQSQIGFNFTVQEWSGSVQNLELSYFAIGN